MVKLTIAICALFISTAAADEWRFNSNYPSGHHSFQYKSGAPKNKTHHRKFKNFKGRSKTHHHVKPYPADSRDPGIWYGYPRDPGIRYGYPRKSRRYRHIPSRSRKETIIIKEKEVIREVPVIIQQPEPQKVWVPPVYEEKVVPGHYISGIREWVDDEGYQNFTDDDSKKVWIPEQTLKVLKKEGYWK